MSEPKWSLCMVAECPECNGTGGTVLHIPMMGFERRLDNGETSSYVVCHRCHGIGSIFKPATRVEAVKHRIDRGQGITEVAAYPVEAE